MYCDVGGIWWSLIGVGECLGNIGGFGECFRRCLGFRQMTMFQNGLKKYLLNFHPRRSGRPVRFLRSSGLPQRPATASPVLPCFTLPLFLP